MNVNLRTARKLEQKLLNYVGLHMDTTTHVSAFDNIEADKLIEESRRFVADEVDKNLRVIQLRSNIRRLIQIANEESGINHLISQRKLYVSVGSFVSTLLENNNHHGRDETVEINATILTGKMTAARETKGNSYHSSDIVSFNSLSSDTAATLNKRMRDSIKQQEKIDEEILSLNVATTIVLSDETVAFLQQTEML